MLLFILIFLLEICFMHNTFFTNNKALQIPDEPSKSILSRFPCLVPRNVDLSECVSVYICVQLCVCVCVHMRAAFILHHSYPQFPQSNICAHPGESSCHDCCTVSIILLLFHVLGAVFLVFQIGAILPFLSLLQCSCL